MKLNFINLFPATIVSNLHSYKWIILLLLFSNSLQATEYNIRVRAAGNSDYILSSSGLGLTASNDPDITVNVGDKLIFDATSSTLGTHPFAIVSALNASTGYSASNLVPGVTTVSYTHLTLPTILRV